MTRLGMVIDLAKCNGCGACAFACKAENNTRDRGHEQSFNWADFLMKTEGSFPKTTHSVIPVLCNHCSDAPCVKICPGNPEKAGNPTKSLDGKPWKAMFKTPEGITLHDPELCVGCGDCQKACPYSQEKLGPIQPGWRQLQCDQPEPRGRKPAAALGRQDLRHPRLHRVGRRNRCPGRRHAADAQRLEGR